MSGFKETLGKNKGIRWATDERGIKYPAVPEQWEWDAKNLRAQLGRCMDAKQASELKWKLSLAEKQISAWKRYRADRAQAFMLAHRNAHLPNTGKIYCAMDIETNDPFLKDYGPGAIYGNGTILGVGIYCPQLNIDTYVDYDNPLVARFLEDENCVVIMHNALYDTDWLNHWAGYEIKCRIEDTMTRQALIDGYSLEFNLDYCCLMYGIEGKNKGDTIDTWWAEHGGKGKAVQNLAKIPREITAKYCKQDCRATYNLFMCQQYIMEVEQLEAINDVECGLYPWLLETKKNGIRVDTAARTVMRDELRTKLKELNEQFEHEYGSYNINSNKQMQELWTNLGLEMPLDPKKGTPSFGDYQLTSCKHPVASLIQEIRATKKLLDTFVDGCFVDMCYKGHIHGTLHPAKQDDAGTVTGRFSADKPNLQQVPAHFYGSKVKKIFIPEDDCFLGAFDYKQIEYRLFAHFSVGDGGVAIRKTYTDAAARGEDVDYHAAVQQLLGWWDPSRPDYQKDMRNMTKRVNFGSLYGLQAKSFAFKFGTGVMKSHPEWKGSVIDLCRAIQAEYYEKATFVKPTMEAIELTGERRGYVRTIGGRRQRNPPNGKLFTLVNYLMQGSAADVAKKAICDSWKAGVWKTLISQNMVHDEFVFSIPKSKEGYEACRELVHYMTHSYPISVPLGVDTEIGPNWKECEMDTWYEFEKEYGNKQEVVIL